MARLGDIASITYNTDFEFDGTNRTVFIYDTSFLIDLCQKAWYIPDREFYSKMRNETNSIINVYIPLSVKRELQNYYSRNKMDEDGLILMPIEPIGRAHV